MFLCRTASEQGGHIGLMTFTTGGQIEAITWNTSQGFSTALSAFIAQNYAAGRTDRVIKSWHTTLLMTSIFGTLCTLLFVFFGNEIFALFVPEQAAYEAGGVFLRIDGYSQLFMSSRSRHKVYSTVSDAPFHLPLSASPATTCVFRSPFCLSHGHGSRRYLVGCLRHYCCQRAYSGRLVCID